MVGLSVCDKRVSVASFHQKTRHVFVELLVAAVLDHPDQIRRKDVNRRVSLKQIWTYEDIYPSIETGSILGDSCLATFKVHLEELSLN